MVDAAKRIEEIRTQLSGIQGWLHDEAGATLYRLALSYAPNGTIVELGSWKGKSTAWLANAVKDRGDGTVYAVDTWKGTSNEEVHQQMLKDYGDDQLFMEFMDNLTGLGLHEYVVPLRKDTISASRVWNVSDKIGLLFIDADHAYEAARADFEMWSPFVQPGGFIAFDDVPAWEGPSRLVSELPSWYRFVLSTSNIWVVQRTE